MADILSDLMLPYVTEEFNPKRIYAFPHPSFQGCGYKSYRTLLVVIEDERQEPLCQLQARAEEAGLEGYGYLFCFQKWNTLATALNAGQLFYSLVCQRKHLVYAKGHEKLILSSSDRLRQVLLKAEIDLSACMMRVAAFLDGARFYEHREDLPMAAFMLQQSIELLFRGRSLPCVQAKNVATCCGRISFRVSQCCPGCAPHFRSSRKQTMRCFSC
ncbi:hypothetical protein [Anseongella ginsenosidimutans]|uniref:hypothetical protein n=1 Tax=Anseongella ginsenosidimutans TaxID=496056 RepID=UPI0011C9701B|nr:hypothetical protein [Anseongella ginsenosidimutans]QEC51960.1 hypothetical protein FRZ59_06180 [Anseongella ginsenosidimutans]